MHGDSAQASSVFQYGFSTSDLTGESQEARDLWQVRVGDNKGAVVTDTMLSSNYRDITSNTNRTREHLPYWFGLWQRLMLG
jgi:hypothetical protein